MPEDTKGECGEQIRVAAGKCILTAGALLAAWGIVVTPTFAQEPPPGSVGELTERTSAGPKIDRNSGRRPCAACGNGHPDLSGVWFPNSAGREVQRAYPSTQRHAGNSIPR